MKYKLITICLMAYISISLWAGNCPAAVPFRSTTSYWEQKTEAEAPACTGFRAIAAQPAALGNDGITYMPSKMATTTLSATPAGAGYTGRKIVNPEDDDDDPANGAPIGNMLLPLLLLSAGYALYVSFRRKKSTCTQK